jgi:hypothetical protein
MNDADFDQLFSGQALLAVSGGPSATLEPVLIRSRAQRREVMCWKRGETTASPNEVMAFNGLTGGDLAERARSLLG